MPLSTFYLTQVVDTCKMSNASLPDVPFDFKLVRSLRYTAVENEAQKQIFQSRMCLQERFISVKQDGRPEAHADL